jgi:hypothetical protein
MEVGTGEYVVVFREKGFYSAECPANLPLLLAVHPSVRFFAIFC